MSVGVQSGVHFVDGSGYCSYGESEMTCDRYKDYWEGGMITYECLKCGYSFTDISDDGWDNHICAECAGTGMVCEHGYHYQHTVTNEKCNPCNGTGEISEAGCTHGQSKSHRYCSHYTTTTLTSHSYCKHGTTEYTSQHL